MTLGQIELILRSQKINMLSIMRTEQSKCSGTSRNLGDSNNGATYSSGANGDLVGIDIDLLFVIEMELQYNPLGSNKFHGITASNKEYFNIFPL